MILKVSEVLVRALEYWGKDGEYWVKKELVEEGSVCLVGGLSESIGGATYLEEMENCWPLADRRVYIQAMRYVYKALVHGTAAARAMPARDIDVETALLQFNDHDSTTFKDVRGVVCSALKQALADEAEESTANNGDDND